MLSRARQALCILFSCITLLHAWTVVYAVSSDVLHWVQDSAIPFLTTDAVEDDTDLEPLRALIGDARIVGLGEQTHGTSEFVTMKHRIIKFLVEEMGFTVIAVEAGWSGGLVTDRFVTSGAGGLSTARESLGFWFYQCEEFSDLLEWVRAHNSTTDGEKVHLVGIDYQSPHYAFEWARSVLLSARASTGYVLDAQLTRDMDRMPRKAKHVWGNNEDLRQEYFDLARSIAERLLADLPLYVEAITPYERTLLERIPEAIEQQRTKFDIPDSENIPNEAGWYSRSFNHRDHLMAENVRWWLETLGDEAKMIVYAHNGHIALSWDEASVVPLGENLRQLFGESYIAVGFSTCEGTATAVNSETRFLDMEIPIPVPSATSYESVLCAVAEPQFLLDLRQLDPASAVGQWMFESRNFKAMGNSPDLVDGVVISAYDTDVSLPKMFDLLVHIRTTQGLRLLD